MAVSRFERYFRSPAGLDVDKADLRRYSAFVNQKLYDLLVIGEAHAKANVRDVIELWDLPIIKGLQESIHRFRELDEEIELQPILEQLAALPPLGLSDRRGDHRAAAGDRRRAVIRAGANLQDHRPEPQKSPDRGVGAHHPRLRTAALGRPLGGGISMPCQAASAATWDGGDGEKARFVRAAEPAAH